MNFCCLQLVFVNEEYLMPYYLSLNLWWLVVWCKSVCRWLLTFWISTAIGLMSVNLAQRINCRHVFENENWKKKTKSLLQNLLAYNIHVYNFNLILYKYLGEWYIQIVGLFKAVVTQLVRGIMSPSKEKWRCFNKNRIDLLKNYLAASCSCLNF
jgi:hypothetical protein